MLHEEWSKPSDQDAQHRRRQKEGRRTGPCRWCTCEKARRMRREQVSRGARDDNVRSGRRRSVSRLYAPLLEHNLLAARRHNHTWHQRAALAQRRESPPLRFLCGDSRLCARLGCDELLEVADRVLGAVSHSAHHISEVPSGEKGARLESGAGVEATHSHLTRTVRRGWGSE